MPSWEKRENEAVQSQTEHEFSSFRWYGNVWDAAEQLTFFKANQRIIYFSFQSRVWSSLSLCRPHQLDVEDALDSMEFEYLMKGFCVEGFDSVFGLFSIQFVKWWTRYTFNQKTFSTTANCSAFDATILLGNILSSSPNKWGQILCWSSKKSLSYLVMIFKIILHLWAQIAGRRYCVFKLHLMLQAASLKFWACWMHTENLNMTFCHANMMASLHLHLTRYDEMSESKN